MTIIEESLSKIRALFEQHSCWMIAPLAAQLGISVGSVRRRLVDLGYFSSITHNGKWYTLSSVPKFDQDGLWFYDEIGFSREGTLTETLMRLVGRSQFGMTADKLGKKLHSRCHAVLVKLCREEKLQREKVGRSFFYLAADPEVGERQRTVLRQRTAKSGPLPAGVCVLVFAEHIRHPEASCEDLAQALSRSSNAKISPVQIETLFAQHGLKKTGGMPERAPSEH